MSAVLRPLDSLRQAVSLNRVRGFDSPKPKPRETKYRRNDVAVGASAASH
jgi:hypothetical protein